MIGVIAAAWFLTGGAPGPVCVGQAPRFVPTAARAGSCAGGISTEILFHKKLWRQT